MKTQIREAVAEATRRGKLRPNSVDSLTGENSGNNLGPGTPIMHFEQWENDDEIEVKLVLKGGGCENMNSQYSLPVELPHIGRADRSLAGVRKCILHAVWHAQGKGCAPGAIGVCIGGDRTSGYVHAKEQLFRTLDDVNPDSRLAELEASIMGEVNKLGIGTMGFGGHVSLIGCKVGALNRLPASFFVSVAYDCWAYRRLGVVLDATSGAIKRWLYRDPSTPVIAMADQAGVVRTGREVALRTPLTEEQVRSLKVGDVVMVSGRAYTGRDAVHHHLMSHEPPVDLGGSVIYHCGPVVAKQPDGGWKVTAAGPTTSIREEPYQAEIIKRYGVRAVIGKGGMGGQDPSRAAGGGSGLFECRGRSGPVLRPLHHGGRRGVADGVWNAGSHVASDTPGLPGHRDDGRPRQQPAYGRGKGLGRGAGGPGRIIKESRGARND
jgi:fumarate hydratase, class I